MIPQGIQAHTAGMLARVLIALLGLSLIGLLVAAVEGRAGWVYASTAMFMGVGVALALHTMFGRSRPGRALQSAGFGPTRQAGTWRAVIDGVPIEAILRGPDLILYASGVPESLSITPGTGGQPTGDTAFDLAVRCAGRSAEVAALSATVRARLRPLLDIGVHVEAGAVRMPAVASAEAIDLTAQMGAAVAHTLRDVRAALLHRIESEDPTLHVPAVAALVAGWPHDPRAGSAVRALLDHPDPAVQARGATISETLQAIRTA